MANYNKVILAGNMTRDPELSYLPSNTPVVEFGLAINRRWNSADGQKRDETCFVDCKAFGKSAEIINQYMAKGRALLVEGRLQFQSWQAQDGSKRSKHIVVVENFQFLGGNRDDDQSTRQPPRQTGAAPGPQAAPGPAGGAFTGNEGYQPPAPQQAATGPVSGDNDVPF